MAIRGDGMLMCAMCAWRMTMNQKIYAFDGNIEKCIQCWNFDSVCALKL